MKPRFEIKVLDDPIGHFRCLLGDHFSKWLTAYATQHDEHFLMVSLRGFLYLMLATLTVPDRNKKIRRQQLIDHCLSQFSGEIKLIDDPIERVRWVLLPKYCRELEAAAIQKDRDWAHQILRRFVLILLSTISVSDQLERGSCKNFFSIVLKNLSDNL